MADDVINNDGVPVSDPGDVGNAGAGAGSESGAGLGGGSLPGAGIGGGAGAGGNAGDGVADAGAGAPGSTGLGEAASGAGEPGAGDGANAGAGDYPALPEGIGAESAEGRLGGSFAEVAKGAGVAPDVFSKLVNGVMEFSKQLDADVEEQRLSQSAAQHRELQQLYGCKFSGEMELANNTLVNLAGELGFDAQVFLLPELRNNPDVIKLFTGLGRKFSEAGFASMVNVPEVANAQQQANDIMSNPGNPDYKAFHDPDDSRWKVVNDRVQRLLSF